MTGVQRYATEVVAALERRCAAGTVTVLEPRAGDPLRARFWELWALSEQARVATGSPATLNLGNWGPLRGIDEATVVVHDTAPLEVPAGFSRVYRSSVWGWMK